MAALPKTDVFVVGGGPVGLAAAIAARAKGLTVTVADALEPPIDKACGEGMMPEGVAAAARLGLHLSATESFAFRGIQFYGEGVSVEVDFSNGPGRGVRRTTLHHALVELAVRRGVDLRWGCSIGGLEGIDARWIIGADGMSSRVRKWAGLDRFRRDTRRYGFRRHFQRAPWSEYVEIYWGDGCQIYVTPVAADEVGLALISRDPKLRVLDALRRFPALAARLEGAEESSTERGALTCARRLYSVTRRIGEQTLALIGDASGSVDAITGDGLSLGFRQSLALAEAMERNDPALYERAHRRLARRPRFMAGFILTIDRWPGLRRRVLPVLASRPELFAGILAMHAGTARSAEFAAVCMNLGWRILTI